MNIAVGSDHRGYALKQHVVARLRQAGHSVVDKGAYSMDSVDYPDIAQAVGADVAGKSSERGIVICGSGIGVSIAANKVAGVRAALCHDERTARYSRLHNDANVLCLGADIVAESLADQMIDVWLATAFEGGRHQNRVNKIERGPSC